MLSTGGEGGGGGSNSNNNNTMQTSTRDPVNSEVVIIINVSQEFLLISEWLETRQPTKVSSGRLQLTSHISLVKSDNRNVNARQELHMACHRKSLPTSVIVKYNWQQYWNIWMHLKHGMQQHNNSVWRNSRLNAEAVGLKLTRQQTYQSECTSPPHQIT